MGEEPMSALMKLMRDGVPEHFPHTMVGAFGAGFVVAQFVEKKAKKDEKTPLVVPPTAFPGWYNAANVWYGATNTVMMVQTGYYMNRTFALQDKWLGDALWYT